LVEADFFHRGRFPKATIRRLRYVANGILCFKLFCHVGNVGIVCMHINTFYEQPIRGTFGIR